eukprot:2820309-Rhodomonas_salina.1
MVWVAWLTVASITASCQQHRVRLWGKGFRGCWHCSSMPQGPSKDSQSSDCTRLCLTLLRFRGCLDAL